VAAASQIDISNVVAELNRSIERATTVVAVEVTAELQESTPVDTGFARASWIPSVGSPSTELGGAIDAPNPAAAEAGIARVLGFRLSDGMAYVSNNARYIQVLDKGSSKQAPAGFVRASIERGLRAAEQVLASSPTLGALRARVLGGA
jgi:hypothetical protein